MRKIAAVVMGSAVILVLSVTETFAEWQMFRGNAGRTAYVNMPMNSTAPIAAWHLPLSFPQSGTGSWREHGVTTDGQRAFITALEGYAPVGNYHVIAVNLDDGTEAWRQTIAGRAFEGVSSPSYMNGTVYINRAGHSGISGGSTADFPMLIGINNVTGTIKWQTPYSAQWGENFRPIPTGNQVFAAGGYYGGFYGYDAKSGAQQWFNSATTWGPPNDGVAVTAEHVLIDNRVYDRHNGAAAGSFNHPTGLSMSTPVVSGTQIFFRTTAGLAAFDSTTRLRQWESPFPSTIRATAVNPDLVVVAAGNSLSLLDCDTGDFIRNWVAPTSLSSEIILTDTHAIVVAGTRTFGINLASGQADWSVMDSGEIAVSGDLLLVSSSNQVNAYRVPEPASALFALTIGTMSLLRLRSRP